MAAFLVIVQKELRKYLIVAIQFYGFGLTIPLGDFFVNFMFERDAINGASFALCFLSFMIGVLLLIVGGIICDNGYKPANNNIHDRT